MVVNRSARIESAVVRVKGVLLSLLAIVHFIGACTFERESIRGEATEKVARDYIVWFSGVGAFILFLGLVDLVCVSGLKKGDLLARRVARLSAVFCVALGVTGMVIYTPVSPPTLIAAVGVAGLVVLSRSTSLPAASEPPREQASCSH